MTDRDVDQLRRDVAALRDEVRALTDQLAAMRAALPQMPETEQAEQAEPSEPDPSVPAVSVVDPPLPPEEAAEDAAEDAAEEAAVDLEVDDSTAELPVDDAMAAKAEALSRVASSTDSPAPRRELSRLEWMVGTRGVAAVGVIILVIAAAFFFKEAWDRGWIGQIPDSVRCAGGATFGLVLLAVGEALRRRISPLASAGVSAAGIAIVYAAILAAAQLYALISMPVAYALLAATTLLGVALGAISNRVPLAALSLIGAFLVPVLLATDEPSTVIMPAYLLALLALGLILSGWRGPAFAIIRRMAWWGTAGLGTLWMLTVYDVAPGAAIAFVATAWTMTIGELVASARFFSRLRPDRPWPEEARHGLTASPSAERRIELDLRSLFEPEARWLLTAFGATAWAVITAAFVVIDGTPSLDWIVPGGFGVASAVVAIAVWPGQRRELVSAATPESALASVMGMIAVTLAALTVATGLGGALQVTAWAGLGLAAVLFGQRVHFRAANFLGLILLAVATGRLMTIDLADATWWVPTVVAPPKLAAVLGILITSWSLQVLMVMAATTVAAWRQTESPYRTLVAVVAAGLAAMAMIGPGSDPLSVGAAWAGLGVVIAGLGSRTARTDLKTLANVLAWLGTLLASISLAGAWQPPADGLRGLNIVWTDASWAMTVIAAAWIAIAAWPGQRPSMRTSAALIAVSALQVALIGGGTDWTLVVFGGACLVAVTLGLGLLGGRGVGVGVGVGRSLSPAPAPLHAWRLPPVSIIAGSAVGAGWIVHCTVSDWAAISAPALAHLAFGGGLLLTGCLLIAARACGPSRQRFAAFTDREGGADVALGLRRVALAAAGLLLLINTTSEIVRITGIIVPNDEAARGAALSIWCSIFAAALISLGIALRERQVRWPGLVLLGLTAAKVLAIDLGTLTPMWRITGSAIVGLVLLGAGVAYAWLVRAEEREDQASD